MAGGERSFVQVRMREYRLTLVLDDVLLTLWQPRLSDQLVSLALQDDSSNESFE